MTPSLPAFFGALRSRVAAERADDLEPETRFTPGWDAWLVRDFARRGRLTQISEAEALSTDHHDPAPLAVLGLDKFLLWTARQRARRTRAGRQVA